LFPKIAIVLNKKYKIILNILILSKRMVNPNMIKIKFYELEYILPSLKTILDKELPIKTSYLLTKLSKQINEEYKFFNDKRMELINKYAKRDDSGKVITNNENRSILIQEEYIEECQIKINELYDIEMDIEFESLSISIFGDISISPKDLLNLDKFLKD
jgi:hypothetical protein